MPLHSGSGAAVPRARRDGGGALKTRAAGRPGGPGAIVLGGGLGAAGRAADEVWARNLKKMKINGFSELFFTCVRGPCVEPGDAAAREAAAVQLLAAPDEAAARRRDVVGASDARV